MPSISHDCRRLNVWGDYPIDFDGVGVSTSTCARNNTREVVKSVVYEFDNYLYYDWDTKVKIM
jgi:hypothetical protein